MSMKDKKYLLFKKAYRTTLENTSETLRCEESGEPMKITWEE